jgi:capsular polysaccharide export protein
VLAGLRAPGEGEGHALAWADEQVTDTAMDRLLSSVDEVHVLTSLAGFEALLREKSVTCYGQPFYAGWGLTADLVPPARRSRKLTLDQLVAGALILYPRYLSLETGALTTPERALAELRAWRARAGTRVPWWRKAFRVVLRQVVGVR